MKKRLPSAKSIGIWLGAFALAVCSLPDVTPTSVLPIPAHHSRASASSVPTLTVPADNAPPQGRDNPTQKKPKPPGQRVTPPPASGQKPAPAPAPRATPTPSDNAPMPTPAPPAPGFDPTQPRSRFTPYVPWPSARLRVRVIDGRTMQPLPGAEVVLIETEQRVTTGQDGSTPWLDAPVIRNPRYRPMVAELHGQLGVIVYKNGYRDSVHLGIRMHEGIENETTVWMYKLGPGDSRVEPVLYQVPYHRIWLIELCDKFRSKTQPGEGPERP